MRGELLAADATRTDLHPSLTENGAAMASRSETVSLRNNLFSVLNFFLSAKEIRGKTWREVL